MNDVWRPHYELTATEKSDIDLTVRLLGALAERYAASGRVEESLRLYRRCVSVVDSLEIRDKAAVEAYSRLAWVLREQGDLKGALAASEKESTLAAGLNSPGVLAMSFGRQALILSVMGNAQRAFELHVQEEELMRQAADYPGVVRAIIQQARLRATAMNQILEAADILSRAHSLCVEHSLDSPLKEVLEALKRCVYMLIRGAAKAEDEDDTRRADAMLKQASDLAERYKLIEELAHAKYNRAVLMATKLGRQREAFPIADDALTLAAQAGRSDLQEKVTHLLTCILDDLGRR